MAANRQLDRVPAPFSLARMDTNSRQLVASPPRPRPSTAIAPNRGRARCGGRGGGGTQARRCSCAHAGREGGARRRPCGVPASEARAPSSRREGCGKSRPENGRRRRCRAKRRRRRRRGGETVSGTAAAAGGDPCRGAGGRGGTWRGRGPRGRRHGWRMASLLSTLPLPPPPVTGSPRPVTHTRGCPSSTRPPRAAFAWRPASSRHRRASRPRAPWAPLSPELHLSGLRVRRALLGASGPRHRRAPAAPASPFLALSPLPSLRAPSPVTRPPHRRACAVRLLSRECATRAPALSPPSPGFASPSFSPIP